MSPDWWGPFFERFYPRYEGRLHSHARTEEEADFIIRSLGLSPGARVLDIACGAGRHAIALANRGFRVAGVDLSEALLTRARREAEERELAIEFRREDMRALPWGDDFDGAYTFFGSFGYFDDAGNAAALRAAAAALKPGGVLLLDTHVAETILPVFQRRGWSPIGEDRVLEERVYDHRSGRIDTQWSLIQGGELSLAQSSMRIYTFKELCRLAEGVGLGYREAFDTRSSEPFMLGAARLSLVLEKGEGRS